MDLFGAKASQENILSVLERFFKLKIARHHSLSSCISVDASYHKVIKFQKSVFSTKIAHSIQDSNKSQWYESKEGENGSPSTSFPQMRRDSKKGKTSEEKPRRQQSKWYRSFA